MFFKNTERLPLFFTKEHDCFSTATPGWESNSSNVSCVTYRPWQRGTKCEVYALPCPSRHFLTIAELSDWLIKLTQRARTNQGKLLSSLSTKGKHRSSCELASCSCEVSRASHPSHIYIQFLFVYGIFNRSLSSNVWEHQRNKMKKRFLKQLKGGTKDKPCLTEVCKYPRHYHRK